MDRLKNLVKISDCRALPGLYHLHAIARRSMGFSCLLNCKKGGTRAQDNSGTGTAGGGSRWISSPKSNLANRLRGRADAIRDNAEAAGDRFRQRSQWLATAQRSP